MATVQWDIVLDVFEGTIRHEKCLCCRAFDYVGFDRIHSEHIQAANIPPNSSTFIWCMATQLSLLVAH